MPYEKAIYKTPTSALAGVGVLFERIKILLKKNTL